MRQARATPWGGWDSYPCARGSCLWLLVSLPCLLKHAPHQVFPKIVKFGGCSTQQWGIDWGLGARAGWRTDVHFARDRPLSSPNHVLHPLHPPTRPPTLPALFNECQNAASKCRG